MAEEKTKPEPVDHLDPYERKYFDTRGESEIAAPPAETPATSPSARPPETPTVEGTAAVPSPSADTGKPADTAAPATVPIASMHEERRRRQEAEERARQAELINARMEERFRNFRDAVTPRQQPQGPPPVDQDIFGAVKHMQQEQVRTRTEIDNYKRQIQQEDYMKQLNDWGRNNEAAFVRANPDYYQALNHMRQARGRQLQIWGMSPSAIDAQLRQEENQLLARAAAERRNPAQMAYAMAHELGYRRGAPAPTQGGDQRQQVNMNQPSQASRAEVNASLDRIQAGQRQAGSLSNVGGGAGRDIADIEVDDLLKMNDKDFGKWIEKHPTRFRQLKGASH